MTSSLVGSEMCIRDSNKNLSGEIAQTRGKVRGHQMVGQNLMQTIKDKENRIVLEPVRDFEEAATLQAKEDLQE
eukprot:3779152-Prorocentrum_lima.AAC.1